MEYTFTCKGHANILSTHKNTIEFTKEKHLTLKGDCIIGVCADFDTEKIKQIVEKASKQNQDLKITITIKDKNIKPETIICTPNKDFSSKSEIVIRKSDFSSERTLGTRCNKAAIDINKEIIKQLTNPTTIVTVVITFE